MKSSILHSMSLLLLLSFSAACGKSASSSGSKAAPEVNNISNTLNTVGSAAQVNLLAWYNSLSEGSLPSLQFPGRILYYTTRPINSGCKTIIKIFEVCGSMSGVSAGTQSQVNVILLASGDKKVGNDKLAAALAPLTTPGTNGLYLTDIKQTGLVYEITYVTADSKKVIHAIDTQYNSRLNPIYTSDMLGGNEVTLTRYFPEN